MLRLAWNSEVRNVSDGVESKLLTALQRSWTTEDLDASSELAALVDDPHRSSSDGLVDAEENRYHSTCSGIIETNDEVVANELSQNKDPLIVTEAEETWEARCEMRWGYQC